MYLFHLQFLKCDTDPWFVVMLDQTSSVFYYIFEVSFLRYLFLTLNEPESVL